MITMTGSRVEDNRRKKDRTLPEADITASASPQQASPIFSTNGDDYRIVARRSLSL